MYREQYLDPGGVNSMMDLVPYFSCNVSKVTGDVEYD